MLELVISILGLYVLYLGYENLKQDKYNKTNTLAHSSANRLVVRMNEDIKTFKGLYHHLNGSIAQLKEVAHKPVDIETVVKQTLEKEKIMPSKSKPQAKLMAAAAHTKGGYNGVSQKVGKEFNKADKGTGILKGKKTKPKSKKK